MLTNSRPELRASELRMTVQPDGTQCIRQLVLLQTSIRRCKKGLNRPVRRADAVVEKIHATVRSYHPPPTQHGDSAMCMRF